MAKTTGVELLSALRKAGSHTLLREVPDTYFLEGDEQEAFRWLISYVQTHHTFPQPTTFRRETGITLYRTPEPPEYYIARARSRALFYGLSPRLFGLQEAMKEKRPDDAVEIAKEMVLLKNELQARSGGIVSLAQAMDEVSDDFESARWRGQELRGIPTGWRPIDLATGGWQNGDLDTFVGRPGTGKTYMLLKSAYAAHAAGYSVVFVSMEMTILQLGIRLLGIHSGINPSILKQGMSSDVEANARTYLRQLQQSNTPLHLIAGNFKKSVGVVRSAVEEHLPDLICVDASYLLTPEKKRGNSSGRREVVSDVIEELGAMAKDVNRPVLNTVQFNRTAVRGIDRRGSDNAVHNPLAHLALHKIGETDVVGQTSSLVIGIERYESPYEHTRRYLGFLKGREGEQGSFVVNYQFSPRVDFSIVSASQLAQENGTSEISLNFVG